jgi:hypothetical protein
LGQGALMKIKFADPNPEDYSEDRAERDNHSKDEIIEIAMDAYQWKEAKVLSWYKLQIPQLGGNSPKELVQRGETSTLVIFLKKKKAGIL